MWVEKMMIRNAFRQECLVLYGRWEDSTKRSAGNVDEYADSGTHKLFLRNMERFKRMMGRIIGNSDNMYRVAAKKLNTIVAVQEPAIGRTKANRIALAGFIITFILFVGTAVKENAFA